MSREKWLGNIFEMKGNSEMNITMIRDLAREDGHPVNLFFKSWLKRLSRNWSKSYLIPSYIN